MGEKRSKGKVYEFTPGKKRKLKTLDYVSPEKKELLKDRKQAKKDKNSFYGRRDPITTRVNCYDFKN